MLDMQSISLNEGSLVLTVVPNIGDDTTDGWIEIMPTEPETAGALYERPERIHEKFFIDPAAGDPRLGVWSVGAETETEENSPITRALRQLRLVRRPF
jgi:hypothetical protein